MFGVKNNEDLCHTGHEPYQVTFSSDYFQQLYDWAVVLIERLV